MLEKYGGNLRGTPAIGKFHTLDLICVPVTAFFSWIVGRRKILFKNPIRSPESK